MSGSAHLLSSLTGSFCMCLPRNAVYDSPPSVPCSLHLFPSLLGSNIPFSSFVVVVFAVIVVITAAAATALSSVPREHTSPVLLHVQRVRRSGCILVFCNTLLIALLIVLYLLVCPR